MRGGFHHEEELPVPIAEVEKIWMDGELVDWADAKIHVLSHALLQNRLGMRRHDFTVDAALIPI